MPGRHPALPGRRARIDRERLVPSRRPGVPGLAAYVASKGALNALTRALAVEGAADGIRANTVAPGYILHERRDADLDDAGRARREAMHLTRLSTAEDVAAAVAFLAGPDAETVTGILLPVDGGSTAARATSFG